jgi:EmrB/QacA subfamily drug resistance transporter
MAINQLGRVNQKVAVGVVYVAAMFMSIMDITVVNTALPTIGHDFSVTPTSVDTISIAYLVSLAIFIPASGWLGDRFGGKRVLLTAISLFTVASVLCGLASSLDELVVFRVVQGAGGGMLAPVGLAMLFRAFPPEERVRAASILTIPTVVAPALGPVLGGLLVTELSWRWVFFINVPIGIGAVIFGALFLRQNVESQPGRFDLVGFLLAGVGLGSLMYGISEGPVHGWGSSAVLATIAAGAVLLAIMVDVELRTTEPIIALRLLGNRLFRSANGIIVMSGIAFLGIQFMIILYFQDGRGLSPLASGLSSFAAAIGVMAGAQLASRLLFRLLGPRRDITFGFICMAISIGLMALMTGTTSLWWSRVLLFGMGLGVGQVFIGGQAVSFATISPADTGRASTLYNTLRQLGGAVGIALLTTVLVLVGATHEVNGHITTDFTAYHVTFLVAAVVCVGGLPWSLSIRDADAAHTIPARRGKKSSRLGTEPPQPAAEPAA